MMVSTLTASAAHAISTGIPTTEISNMVDPSTWSSQMLIGFWLAAAGMFFCAMERIWHGASFGIGCVLFFFAFIAGLYSILFTPNKLDASLSALLIVLMIIVGVLFARFRFGRPGH